MTVVVTHTTPADSSFSTEGAAAWNANHTLTGVGTMAEQDANSVAVTGGSINGTTIGFTTASTGKFTDLTDTSLTAGRVTYAGTGGNLVDSASLTFDGTTLSTNQLTATGQVNFSLTSLTGPSQVLFTNSAQTSGYMEYAVTDGTRFAELGLVKTSASSYGNTNEAFVRASGATAGLSISSASTNPIRFSTGASGNSNEQFRVSNTASAVNYVQVTGAATGNIPVISAQGSDANVALTVQSKGTSGILFQVNGGSGFRVRDGGANPTNYLFATGSVASTAPRLSVDGSDTNIAATFQSKGTGAINLAPGSSGVNISNGGTVTALTRTSGGTGYTSSPTVAISAPTTAGGVQATATWGIGVASITINGGGTGYSVNDTLTVSGGTFTSQAVITVTGVSGGVITTVSVNSNTYSVAPANPVSVTGGTGTGATFNLTWGLSAQAGAFTITNAGSGYVEQPTVTFSGGGGSGAAAYATVGSISRLTSVGSGLELAAASGIGFRVANSGTANVNYYSAQGNSSGGSTLLAATGSDTDISAALSSKGAGSVRLQTNNSAQEQLRVAHTASAVNYVQVTGAATGGATTISSQGSDATVSMLYAAKGGAAVHQFRTNGTANIGFQITAGTNAVNFVNANGVAAGSAPSLAAQGTDTNIDLALTPKGTGRVQFGTYTATVSSITGYIEIKDSGGTVRRLAVVA